MIGTDLNTTTSSPGLIPRVSAQHVAGLLKTGAELALIDVREEGVFARGHLLFAASIPLARLELRARRAIPRLDTPVILIADDPADTDLAASRLKRGGYTNVSALDGGNTAWTKAGYQLFSGVFVPSKAFGEVVEHANHTPRISATAANEAMRRGEARLYVDSRPLEEFRNLSLPNALDCPGAELVLRAPAAAGANPIVVNCAGRTRSIIGAQSLINAGIPNPVYALENGAMGWRLSGLELRHGVDELLPIPAAADIALARQRARSLAEKLGAQWIDDAKLQALLAQADRTTYCFDVRLPEDYAAGHLPGFFNAPGGQLVQATDVYAPVRNARMVLFDEFGVQAPMTAHWLRQMGWTVFIVETALDAGTLEKGTQAGPPLYPPDATQRLDVPELMALLRSNRGILIDCDDSRAFNKQHLRGARWITRSRIERIAELTGAVGPHTTIVFTSDDGVLAQYAAADAAALGLRAAWIAGGTRGGASAMGAVGLTSGPDFLCETDDAFYSPYQLPAGVEKAMQTYIDWETGLLDRLKNEPGLHFNVHVHAN